MEFRWWNDKQWSLKDFTLKEPKVIKESNALLAFEGFGSIGGDLENNGNISDFEMEEGEEEVSEKIESDSNKDNSNKNDKKFKRKIIMKEKPN